MKATEVNTLLAEVGLARMELAKLLGVTPRALRRGCRFGSPADQVFEALRQGLGDPRLRQSTRALLITTARDPLGDNGLHGLIVRLLHAYSTLDHLHR